MAYFDSAKNRVEWQKELARLRAEKERRASAGCERAAARQDTQRHRVRITFKELEAEEYEAARTQRAERGKDKAREREASHGAPERTEVKLQKQGKGL